MQIKNKDNEFIETDIDIKLILIAVVKEWKFLLYSFLIFLFVSMIFIITRPIIYSCESKFITKNNETRKISGLEGIAAFAGINLNQNINNDPSNYIAEIVQDEDFLNNITKNKWNIDGKSQTLAEFWEIKIDQKKRNGAYYRDRALYNKLRTETINLLDQDGLKVLKINSENPELAYKMNKQVLDLINTHIIDNSKSQIKESRIFIQMRIKETALELKTSEDKIISFLEKNLDRSSPQIASQLKRLQRDVAINEEIYLQLKKQLELIRIEETKDRPLVIVIKKPELPLTKSKPNYTLLFIVSIIFSAALSLFIGLGKATISSSHK